MSDMDQLYSGNSYATISNGRDPTDLELSQMPGRQGILQGQDRGQGKGQQAHVTQMSTENDGTESIHDRRMSESYSEGYWVNSERQ